MPAGFKILKLTDKDMGWRKIAGELKKVKGS